MSLFGSLYTSVSGLSAQSQALSMISANIANTSTVGYKSDSAQFADLVTQAGASTSFSSGGVVTSTVQNIDQQGLLQQTQSSTDMAISGNGFFVVQQSPTAGQTAAFTRAGSFSENSQGYLVNTQGYYLMGWPLNNGALPASTSTISSLVPVNLNTVATSVAPTANAAVNLNLNASDTPAVAPATNYSYSLQVYDSLGAPETIQLAFNKTAANTWTLTTTSGSPAVSTPTGLTFSSSGVLTAPASGTISVAGINWGNGSAPQTVSIDISKISQLSAPYSVSSVTQDGASFGTETGVSVSKTGVVSVNYSNGQIKQVYQLPIATFTADSQLSSGSGDVFLQTQNSGTYYLNQAGQGGAGSVSPSSLEQSNVDLATEFSNMIVTQQAYNANSKVLSAANTMLQDLLQVQV
ncbi:MAG TPA: flagellar hook protein FlgE [Alphaproteobacteria bacterium]|nr:flagellar hook protein FlgE [Alphaproteobacteria bacterium]